MPSERIQRRVDAFLDEAEAAAARRDWAAVSETARAVLAIDNANEDALAFLKMAEANGVTGASPSEPSVPPTAPAQPLPDAFAAGRYTVHGFLGEGGSKKVYLAHDTRLDRDVAVAVVEGLDGDGLERVRREAQAVARLGDHPNIVGVFDTGEEDGSLYTVYQYMSGGSALDVIARAAEHRLPLDMALRLASQVCAALTFAHDKGVIHRDLKPANVFLDEGGTAKLGDFGLAAALDRTRMTQQGSFLGTATYMAPEQAMGQPPDPRSDLYALGCVLYEMLTGRPPFVGDDTVAVVTQHLNTPPVAPSWHRPDVPPPLEALVLRLLEKDPGKRPQSAAEAAQSLRAIDLAQVPPQSSVLAPPSSDPLYRTVFVGREQELRQAQAAFDTALSGNGGLVMVVGEPGIGKTALTEQLATYVAMRGGRALHGNCYEEGSLSLPYLPFVEAMRSYVLDHDPEALRSELGSNAPYVAKIVSEVRERVSVDLPPAGDPEDERWRLLQSVTGFLKNASTVQPLCIVLEDLHWSDRGTLDLLNHLARNLQGARLLIVGTYRDVEVDRTHPLSAALADLRRSTNFTRVTLRGLGVDDVAKMLSAIAGRQVPRQVAAQVHRQTEGNPLFVQEVVRYLVEEGHLGREGQRSGDEPLAMQIPEGLRDVIGRRISRLAPETNRVLAVAAVIGRDFSFDVLSGVANLPDEAVIAAIEEATRVGVLQEEKGRGTAQYRFAHAFIRQTLYEEMIAPRRLRLHQEVARALETRYARRLDEHAAELAEHFSYSTDPADLEKAVSYAERASQRAMAVFDYGEAARLLEKALGVQDVLDPDDVKRHCELQLALAWAKQREGDQAAAREFAMAVAGVARAEGLVDFVARVGELLAIQTFHRMQTDEPFGQLFADLLELLPPGDSPERAFAMARLGLYLAASGTDPGRGDALTSAAVEMARRVGELRSLTLVLGARSSTLFQLPLAGTVEEDLAAKLALADEIERVVPSGQVEAEARVVLLRLGAALARGNRERTEQGLDELDAFALRYRSGYYEGNSRSCRMGHLFSLGRLNEAVELAERARIVSSRVTSPSGGEIGGTPINFSRLLSAMARTSEAETRVSEVATESVAFGLLYAWLLARHGNLAAARALYEKHRTTVLSAMNRFVSMAQCCTELMFLLDDPAAADLYRDLLPHAGFNVGSFATIVPVSHGPADRCLGLLATTMGQFDIAEKHFLAAIEQCERQGTPTFLVESHYNYADMLLRRDGPADREKARALLTQAIDGAQAIGYVWLVEHALALQLELQGIAGSDPSSSIVAVTNAVQTERPNLSIHAAPDGTVTLMFTDIENSTPLNEKLGDAKWMKLLREHNATVEREVKNCGGRVVKNRGDGFMLAFGDHGCALDCALTLQKAFQDHDVVHIRIGLHVGNPVREGEDFFGTDVNLAARVADRALGGQVLVSARLYDLLKADRAGLFGAPVEVELKGLAGKHRIYAVVGA